MNRLKELYNKDPYADNLNFAINILLYLLHCISVYQSMFDAFFFGGENIILFIAFGLNSENLYFFIFLFSLIKV